MNNPVLKVIASRSSIRAYTSKKLTKEEIDTLKKAALCSPTALNKQTQRFFFITSSSLNQEIEEVVVKHFEEEGNQNILEHLSARNNKVLYDAPLFVVIAVDSKNLFGKIDAGIAVQTLALAAKSMGLESVILGFPAIAFEVSSKGKYFKEKLDFPEGYEYGIGIVIGYGDTQKEPHTYDFCHAITIE